MKPKAQTVNHQYKKTYVENVEKTERLKGLNADM